MKQQLSDCKMGRVRNFGFGSILSTFLFERVPGLSPRVEIPPHEFRDLAQDVGQISCIDLGEVGWLTPTQQTSFHGGRGGSLPSMTNPMQG